MSSHGSSRESSGRASQSKIDNVTKSMSKVSHEVSSEEFVDCQGSGSEDEEVEAVIASGQPDFVFEPQPVDCYDQEYGNVTTYKRFTPSKAQEHEHMRNSSENLSFTNNKTPSSEEDFSHYSQSGLRHYSHDARNSQETSLASQGNSEVGTAAYNLEQHYSRIARAAGNADVDQNRGGGRETSCNEFAANDLNQRSSLQTSHSVDVTSAEAKERSASIERKHRARSGSRERTECGRRTSDINQYDFDGSVVSSDGYNDGHIPKTKRGSNAGEFASYDLEQSISRQKSRDVPAAGLSSHSTDVHSDEARERSAAIERNHRSRSGSRERAADGHRPPDFSKEGSVFSSAGCDGSRSPQTKRGSNSDEFAVYDLEQSISRQKSRDVPAAGLSSHSADVYSDEARERSAAIERNHRSRSNSRERAADGRRTPDFSKEGSVFSSDGYNDGPNPQTKRGSNADEFASYDLEQRISRQKSRDVPAAGFSSHSTDVCSDEASERSDVIARDHRSRSGSRERSAVIERRRRSRSGSRERTADGRRTPDIIDEDSVFSSAKCEGSPQTKRVSKTDESAAYDLDQRISRRKSQDMSAAGLPSPGGDGRHSPFGDERRRRYSIDKESNKVTTDESLDEKEGNDEGAWLQDNLDKRERSMEDVCFCNNQGATGQEFVHFNHCRYYADPADARNLHDSFQSRSAQGPDNSDADYQCKRPSPPPLILNSTFSDEKVLIDNETTQDYDRRHIASANHPLTSFKNMKHN